MFQRELSTQSNKLKERTLIHKRITDLAELQSIYELGEVLGKGTFGTVIKANHRVSNVDWAIKIVNKSQAGASRVMLVEREIYILKLVNHPNIIFLDRVFESPKTIYLVFELCTGSLAKTFKLKKRFDETETLPVIRSLASALAYLHKNDIVHRDLKLENILIAVNPVNPNDNLHIKVTDFGLSAVRGGKGYESMLHDCCGTLTYMAPEMITSKSYSQQCDVWSMGVIMYILIVGKFPFYSSNDQQLHSLVKTQELDFADLPCSTEAQHLLSKMLQKNPAFRMTAAEVENHPWISGTGSSLHVDSSNVLDMMRLWKPEMMQSSEENFENIAVDGGMRNYTEIKNSAKPSSAQRSIVATEQPTFTKAQSLSLYKNGENSTTNESPYPKHRFWENVRSSSDPATTEPNSSSLEIKTNKPPLINDESRNAAVVVADNHDDDRSLQSERYSETAARISSTAETIINTEKKRVNMERRRVQSSSSRVPDFRHVPAKVDSNLATLRKEAQVQRKRGSYIRNSKP